MADDDGGGGGGTVDRTLRYTMQLVDNVSSVQQSQASAQQQLTGTIEQTTEAQTEGNEITAEGTDEQTSYETIAGLATQSLNTEQAAAVTTDTTQQDLAKNVDSTNTGLMAQNINFMTQITTLRALHSGLTGITSSMSTLGIITGQNSEEMKQLAAVAQGALSIFYLFKGASQMIDMVRDSEIAESAVAYFRAALANPLMLAVGAAAIGGGIGVGAALMTQGGSTSTTVNNTVNFTSGQANSNTRAAAAGQLEAMGGF